MPVSAQVEHESADEQVQRTAFEPQRSRRTQRNTREDDDHGGAGPKVPMLPSARSYESSGSQPQSLVRSEEHTSELQSLMRNSYAVVCLKKNNKKLLQNKSEPTKQRLHVT